MKKVIVAVVFMVLAGLAFSGCKSHEPCPAYGSADTEVVQDVA